MFKTSLKPHLKMSYRKIYQEAMRMYHKPLKNNETEKANLFAFDIGLIDSDVFYVTAQSIVSSTRMLFYAEHKTKNLKIILVYYA